MMYRLQKHPMPAIAETANPIVSGTETPARWWSVADR
jgi:hypothetical protein